MKLKHLKLRGSSSPVILAFTSRINADWLSGDRQACVDGGRSVCLTFRLYQTSM